jgi:hypothetical protein
MTRKTAFRIVVPTTAAVALGIALLFGAVRHFAPVDQTGANHVTGADKIAEVPDPALSRVRLLISNPN